MSTDYFLFLLKKHKKIVSHLSEINNIYENLLELTNNYDENKVYNKEYNAFFKKCNSHYQSEILDAKYQCEFIKHNLQCCCSHMFVKDLIDIDLDRSKEIEYCSVCEYTKK